METPDWHEPRTGPCPPLPWRRRLAGLGLMLFALHAGAAGDPDASPDPRARAAYILNFARYTSWPPAVLADARAPLVLCMMGQGGDEIARLLQGRAAGSHSLDLRTISSQEEAAPCHALYFGPPVAMPERARQAAWLARLRDQAVLTIGDSASFLADGGMINMMPMDGGIRFEVNLAAARQSGISLNPRVLGLAERVVGGSAR